MLLKSRFGMQSATVYYESVEQFLDSMQGLQLVQLHRQCERCVDDHCQGAA